MHDIILCMKKLYDFDSFTFKCLRLFPGLVTILLIISPLLAVLLHRPQYIAYYVLFLSIFWVYRSIRFLYGLVIGYLHYKRDLRTDWNKKFINLQKTWNKLPTKKQLPKRYDDFYTTILIPVYKEPYEIIERTVEGLKKSKFPLKKLFVIFAVEERGGVETLNSIKKVQQKYKKYFADLLYYVHPQGLPNEVIGIAGPNLKWAAKHFTEDYLKKRNIAPNNVFMFKYDVDLVVHEQLIAGLSYKYLVTPDRYYKYFTNAVKLYSNNFWDVPVMMRLFSGFLSLVLLSEWVVAKHKKQSFSAYGFNLKLLKDFGYWDARIGVDDTGFFWLAFLHTNGRFSGETVYLPSYSDAVDVGDYWKSHIAQYKQQVRWGSGAIVAPLGIQGMFRNKNIPWKEKLSKLLLFFETYSFLTTAAYFLGVALPVVTVLAPGVNFHAFAHVIPVYVSQILSASMIFMLPMEYMLIKLYGLPPRKRGFFLNLLFPFEFLLIVVVMYFYNMIPYVKAQVDLMMGRFGRFYVVEKKATR